MRTATSPRAMPAHEVEMLKHRGRVIRMDELVDRSHQHHEEHRDPEQGERDAISIVHNSGSSAESVGA